MTGTLSIDEAKAELRKSAARRRGLLAEDVRMQAAESLAEVGLAFLPERTGAVVSGYHPIGEELDPRPLLARLAGEGHPLVLPVTPRGRGRLTFRCWTPGDELVAGSYGVSEPSASSPAREPSILLVPLLAFDAGGQRLGYGAGYYDRTLAELRAAGRVTAVGIAFAEQEVAAVPHDRYDQRLDWILTPDGPRRIGG